MVYLAIVLCLGKVVELLFEHLLLLDLAVCITCELPRILNPVSRRSDVIVYLFHRTS